MAEFSFELRTKLKKAESREEVEALLKTDGQDTALTDEVWRKAEELRARDGQELSMDELEDVAGGRDWYEEGCAATVEDGSDCWATDGGCTISNISYSNLPNGGKCTKCGRSWCVRELDWGRIECKYCGIIFDPHAGIR